MGKERQQSKKDNKMDCADVTNQGPLAARQLQHPRGVMALM
jgi:hypothetical protein